jgi:hypothetical protein
VRPVYFPHLCPSANTLFSSPEGTRSAVASDDDSLEGLVERTESAIREVGVRLNELSGRLLEVGDMQAAIRKRMGKVV